MFLLPFKFHSHELQKLMIINNEVKRLFMVVTGLEGEKTHKVKGHRP